MKPTYWKKLLFTLTTLVLILDSTLVSAYQFGPPPITELAESGGTQSRLSLYSQTTVLDGLNLTPLLQGISYVATKGDNSGGTSGMLRVAHYTDNRTAIGAASDSTGALIGGGIGGQWYFGTERNFGLILDGQMDYLYFNYDTTLSNNTAATLDNSQLALGVEVGATYRIFIGTATITPFFTAMQGVRHRSISTVSSCSNCAQDYSYQDSATTVGIDLMMGKLSATFLQTSDSYIANSNGVTYPAQKGTITMYVLGYNF